MGNGSSRVLIETSLCDSLQDIAVPASAAFEPRRALGDERVDALDVIGRPTGAGLCHNLRFELFVERPLRRSRDELFGERVGQGWAAREIACYRAPPRLEAVGRDDLVDDSERMCCGRI